MGLNLISIPYYRPYANYRHLSVVFPQAVSILLHPQEMFSVLLDLAWEIHPHRMASTGHQLSGGPALSDPLYRYGNWGQRPLAQPSSWVWLHMFLVEDHGHSVNIISHTQYMQGNGVLSTWRVCLVCMGGVYLLLVTLPWTIWPVREAELLSPYTMSNSFSLQSSLSISLKIGICYVFFIILCARTRGNGGKAPRRPPSQVSVSKQRQRTVLENAPPHPAHLKSTTWRTSGDSVFPFLLCAASLIG